MALFQDYDASQDPPGEVIFQSLTLIYGNNGSGKSTLATFFRTLRDTIYIPLSLPVLHSPHSNQYAKIILDTRSGHKPSEYVANEWSHRCEEVKVFDEDYLNSNTLLFQANMAKSGFHMVPGHSSRAGERSRSAIHLIRDVQIATWCFNVQEPYADEIRHLIEHQQRIPYDFFIQYQQNVNDIEKTFSALLDKPFGFEINNPIDRSHWMTLVRNSTHIDEDGLRQVQDAYDQNHNTIMGKIQEMFERVNVSLGSYRLAINKYLKEFATSLQITKLELKRQAVIRKYRRQGWEKLRFDFNVYSPIKHYYEGEFVQCCITLRGQPLTDLYLSEADRRAFAMSIFFTNLVEQQNDQQQIVVMDDPVTSLDANRKSKTLHFIINLFERQLVKQVIVLSHNADALRELWKLAQKKKIETSMLQISKNHTKHTSSLCDMDLDNITGYRYTSERQYLEEYCERPSERLHDKRAVLFNIRYCLEKALIYNPFLKRAMEAELQKLLNPMYGRVVGVLEIIFREHPDFQTNNRRLEAKKAELITELRGFGAVSESLHAQPEDQIDNKSSAELVQLITRAFELIDDAFGLSYYFLSD